MIDLHVHTTVSDGTLSPKEVVRLAENLGLYAIAITDHDTVSGIDEALNEASNLKVKIICGTELSCQYKEFREIHILGYSIDHKSPYLVKRLSQISKDRNERNRKVCEKLQSVGFNVTLDDLKKRFKDAILTRANFAQYMTENGFAESQKEAFEKYLNYGCPCHVPKKKLTIADACEIIINAGGLPVVAHPTTYKLSDSELSDLIKYAKESGVKGLEAIYSTNKEGETEKFINLANENGLFITGGSDFHGTIKPDISLGTGLGNLRIPDELLKNLGD